MNKIGIIAAMDEEVEEIKKKMKKIRENKIYNLVFFEGIINEKSYVLVKCGVGKVNAARTTQIMIEHYELQYIINVGSAGAVNDELSIGDIVIGEKLVQHDFDITAFGHKKGYITDTGNFFFSDKVLVQRMKKIIEELSYNKEEGKCKAIVGTIASGDIFCTELKMKEKIRNKFQAECVEMEAAAIAQVCYLDKVPFVVIRSISDTPNGNNQIDFNEFVTFASKRCADFVEKI